jgi:hypothetical protein
VRNAKFWPVGGSDSEVVDLVGVHDDGRPVVGAIRDRLTLAALGPVLDAALALRPSLPTLLAGASPPLCIVTPRLLLAAKTFDTAVLRVLASLAVEHAAYDVEPRRGRDPVLVLREGAAAAAAIPAVPGVEAPADRAEAPQAARAAEEEAPQKAPASAAGSRSRGRRAGRRERGAETPEAAKGAEATSEAPTFDEISLFDLADDQRLAADTAEEAGGRRPRRGRGRRRRRGRGPANGEEASEDATFAASGEEAESEEAEPGAVEESGSPSARRRGRRSGRRAPAAAEEVVVEEDLDATDDIENLSDTLVPLDDVPDLGEMAALVYDDEEEEEGADDLARRRREAEQRAIATRGEEPEPPEPDEKLSLPRKRAAIVVHGDRASLICGLLLARDLRQIEGLWVYGQRDLMTFFRAVATDLREDTPIYIIGFMPSPVRDALQAASLYRGRLAWFDHHVWPPEDLGAMREAVGSENLHVMPGAESCLSEVLSVRSRRSRFSDKVVELATGRFTQHDYERWGRLWWHRLGEIAQGSGERRAEFEALLVGRPSDLAKEASGVPEPPEPPEVAFVSERDFRLVHFHGFTLVVVPTPAEIDIHLASRIARERYDAQVSVARVEGEDLVVLGGEEGRGRRSIDLASMVEHLVSKHDWVVPLPDEDHVARLRIRDVATRPERFGELISEIAMGRSILEG